MIIKDRVYGKVKITDPVILEAIRSRPLQRLKGINQAGASKYALKGKDVTRYEHSIGVMLLLRKLDASVEEQLAGLMHDIPHTAFSHVIDFVFNDKEHEFHERFHEKIIMDSEIPRIIKKHGFSIRRLLDEHNFPLLENTLPNLCADRIDYTLRDMIASYKRSKKIDKYLDNFIIYNNEIMMKDKTIAKKFALDYIMMDEGKWSHPLEVALYYILADAIRIALKNNILSEEDLFQDDDFVYKKLKRSKNTFIQQKLKMLNPKLKITDNPKDYDFHSKSKLRFIDPKFLHDGKILRVSDFYPGFKKNLEKHKIKSTKGNFIKVISW